MNNKKRFSFRIHRTIYEQVKHFSLDTGVPITKIINKSLEIYLRQAINTKYDDLLERQSNGIAVDLDQELPYRYFYHTATKNDEERIPISINLNIIVYAQLRDYSNKMGSTMTSLTEESLIKYLEAFRRR